MKSIKIILSAFVFFAMVSISYAQEATVAKISDKKETPAEKTERYIKQLELKADQADQVRKLSEKYNGLIANAKTPQEKKTLKTEVEIELKKILTEDQYNKYYALKTADQNPQSAQPIQPRRPTPANN
ncbi:MAG: hypothetical protein IT232_04100 [Flavobacteriales bacterium]|nr:hypothetical protein [Flavobacteriales bacterium]